MQPSILDIYSRRIASAVGVDANLFLPGAALSSIAGKPCGIVFSNPYGPVDTKGRVQVKCCDGTTIELLLPTELPESIYNCAAEFMYRCDMHELMHVIDVDFLDGTFNKYMALGVVAGDALFVPMFVGELNDASARALFGGKGMVSTLTPWLTLSFAGTSMGHIQAFLTSESYLGQESNMCRLENTGRVLCSTLPAMAYVVQDRTLPSVEGTLRLLQLIRR